jgi:hypothetical protein
MIERAEERMPVSAVRIGRTDIGAATAVVDEDTITFLVSGEGDGHPLRLALAAIDGVRGAGNELEIIMRDGTRVTVASPSRDPLEAALLRGCRTLPELTRTLRAFGSSRGRRTARASGAGEQQRFFAPLIESRRSAMHTAGAGAIAAFDAGAIAHAMEETLARFAAERFADVGPARRALEAELVDISEPLFDALRVLNESAALAREAPDDLRCWRNWSSQLRVTFECADRVWIALDAALDGTPAAR